MTVHQTPPPTEQVSAADRARAFLAERKPMKGLDPQHITACNEASLTVADLETLIHQADSLRHYAPFTHRNIEAQYQGLDGPTDSA